uniref:Disease resistance protein RPM1 n=1 Tax=Aegilops tauschii TaxID=37682 RepID=R7W8B3_AEGTA
MALPLPLDEAASEIEQLKARVEDVSTRNTRYSLISDTGSKPIILQQERAAFGAAIIAATTADMLAEARGATKRQQGFSDLTWLITKKKHDHNNGLQVISVWGAAGDHGITSIIRKTYNHTEICQDFPFRSWVKIIHPFSPHQFMRNMMAQFHVTSCMEHRAIIGRDVFEKMGATQEDLLTEFERIFKKKRYLIVLEGLSHMVDWDAIRAFLPDTINGSRIIVLTQQSEIATLCIGHSYQVVELRKFSDAHAVVSASQGDGDKDKNPVDADAGKDQGIEPMASMENKVREEKIMSLKEEAKEWREENDGLVGRESQMTDLVKCLSEARVHSLPVMSVWGIAQVGKSALVKKLFYDTVLPLQGGKSKYEDYYWVDVSHPFNMRDLYMTLLSDFHSEKEPTEECHRLLKKDWCLIVIDDLLSTKDWDMIQSALVSKHLKSVVIVITTDPIIAEYCTNKEELVFNVKALEATDAFDLFKKQVLKKVLPYPLNEHEKGVKELISKCGGLPKVISAIAALLATKTSKRIEIINSLNDRFMHRLKTDLEYDNLQDLFGWLNSYFRTCPDALKPCIFYLSIFPQDKTIRRRRLVRRWIAEGYSRDSDNESAEENGEKHFAKLLELSIIQQISLESLSSSTSVNSYTFSVDKVRMVMCQVNGFIREYVVSRRMEENLVFELGGKCALTTQRNGRHLVILDTWRRDKIVFASMDFSRLRSLTVFGGWESFFISESMKMLRVLDLENAKALNDGDLAKILDWLRRLKFLSLRGHTEINHLPGSLHHLRQLQTLDVRGTSITTLPKKITKLQKLQYIRAGTLTINIEPPVSSSRCSRPTISVEVPAKIGELTALHTLGVVNITASGTKKTVKELQKLTQLRKLGVSGINGKNNSNFFSAIKDHAHLESLSISLNKDNKKGRCLDDMIFLPCTNLRSLKLYGLEDMLPKWTDEQLEKFENLTKLELEMASLPEDVIRLVDKLPELRILRVKLRQAGELNFCVMVNEFEADSYKKIKILEISCSESLPVSVTFGSSTMKNLELLKVECYGGLPPYEFSGLGDLEELREIVLVNGSNAQALKQQLDDQLVKDQPKEKKPVVKLLVLKGHQS